MAARRGLTLAALALAGCGESAEQRACAGHEVPPERRELVLFGAVDDLDRERLCETAGPPDQLVERDGREEWRYGDTTFVLDRSGRPVGVR